jgi:hypothetical protein
VESTLRKTDNLKSDPGEVFAGRQPGELHLDEIKLVVDHVEVSASGIGLPQAQVVFGWLGHGPSYAAQPVITGLPVLQSNPTVVPHAAGIDPVKRGG